VLREAWGPEIPAPTSLVPITELEQILRGGRKARAMNNDFSAESPGSLLLEIERYLTAVDTFRSLDCEPTWRPEPSVVLELIRPHVASPAARNTSAKA
jgi:hypothetical protein